DQIHEGDVASDPRAQTYCDEEWNGNAEESRCETEGIAHDRQPRTQETPPAVLLRPSECPTTTRVPVESRLDPMSEEEAKQIIERSADCVPRRSRHQHLPRVHPRLQRSD